MSITQSDMDEAVEKELSDIHDSIHQINARLIALEAIDREHGAKLMVVKNQIEDLFMTLRHREILFLEARDKIDRTRSQLAAVIRRVNQLGRR